MDGFLAERVISELPDGLRDVDVFEEMVILLGFEEDVFFLQAWRCYSIWRRRMSTLKLSCLRWMGSGLLVYWCSYISIYYKIKNSGSFEMVVAQVSLH